MLCLLLVYIKKKFTSALICTSRWTGLKVVSYLGDSIKSECRHRVTQVRACGTNLTGIHILLWNDFAIHCNPGLRICMIIMKKNQLSCLYRSWRFANCIFMLVSSEYLIFWVHKWAKCIEMFAKKECTMHTIQNKKKCAKTIDRIRSGNGLMALAC